jgi:hypothetical protein
MDPFVVLMIGGVAAIFVALLLLGYFYPGNGTDVLEWKPTRSAEVEVQNEIDDIDQMLEAANARRRARGQAELTEESLRQDVAEHLNETHKRRDDYMADLEIVQMLEVKNRRRKAKGLDEITLADFKASLEGPL